MSFLYYYNDHLQTNNCDCSWSMAFDSCIRVSCQRSRQSRLLGSYSQAPKSQLSESAEAFRQKILPLIGKHEKDVVVLCHSYDEIPDEGAAHSISKAFRVKHEQKGGMVELVYLAAFVVPEKAGLLQTIEGNHALYVVHDQVFIHLLSHS